MPKITDKLAGIEKITGKLPDPVRDFISLYFENRITRSAASLSYFLTLSVFPFLICANAVLGSLRISSDDIFEICVGILPYEMMDVITSYLQYIQGNNSKLLLLMGIFVMIVSSSAAFRVIFSTMGEMQGKSRFTGIFGVVFSFIFAILLLAVMYISCIVIVSGNSLIHLLIRWTGLNIAMNMWRWMRFLVLFLLLYGVVYCTYRLSAPKNSEIAKRGIGAFFATLVLVLISIVFSWMVNRSIRYTLVYGSLASIIILMVWLYMCSNVLLLGNIINIVLYKYRYKKKQVDIYRESK